jgi:hypothetical protein
MSDALQGSMQLVLMQGLVIVIGQFPAFEYSLSLCEAFSE